MKDSNMTEDSEYLTVVPAQYLIIRQKRHKYRCSGCHGSIQTTPVPPRIKPKSSYSDELMLDVALSKYCDLIPIERYSAMAGRSDLPDLPPQSLIQLTHNVADFINGAYQKLKEDVKSSSVLHADETPHRMFEQGDGKKWYLWGFCNGKASYFEIHNTRSGDVSSNLLKNSSCEYLVSDVFSGYNKTVTQVNQYREEQGVSYSLKNVYCNAHARRKFKDAGLINKGSGLGEAQAFVDIYKKIYRLEKIARARPPDRILRVRRLMKPLFEKMKTQAIRDMAGYSSKSSIGKAMGYFLRNYEGLTLFLKKPTYPLTTIFRKGN